MKLGDLVLVPFNAFFANAHLSMELRRSFVEIEAGSNLLCIEEMDLTKEFLNFLYPLNKLFNLNVRAADVSTSVMGSGYQKKNWSKAKAEYDKTEKIKGYKFLCPDGKSYIWISHYDIGYLLNLKI